MRIIILILSVLISTNIFAQEGYFKIPSRFYTIVDSSRKFQCCDSNMKGLTITYDIPLYEYPYSHLDLKDFEERQMEDGHIESYIQSLVEAYYKIKPEERNKIQRSCYKIFADYKIHHDYTSDTFYWIEGTLRIKLIFQSNDPDFGKPWWKKTYEKLNKRLNEIF